jgi:hypothetical protein
MLSRKEKWLFKITKISLQLLVVFLVFTLVFKVYLYIQNSGGTRQTITTAIKEFKEIYRKIDKEEKEEK